MYFHTRSMHFIADLILEINVELNLNVWQFSFLSLSQTRNVHVWFGSPLTTPFGVFSPSCLSLLQFDHDSLSKGFSRDLQQFYGKANEQDKRRCLELLASLHIGEDLNKRSAVRKPTRPKDTKLQRPKTAMASFGTLSFFSKPFHFKTTMT